MLKGFRAFLLRGNVIDLAVGVVIGVAFSAIVDSLVKDVIMPIIGMMGGQPDFSAIKLGPVLLGNFVNAVIAFLIKAAGLYVFVVLPFSRLVAKMMAASPPTTTETLLREIRDLLAAQPKRA